MLRRMLPVSLAMLLLVGCIPPVVIFLPEAPAPMEALATGEIPQLAEASRRQIDAPGTTFQQIAQELVGMDCRILSSDATGGILVFDRIAARPKHPPLSRGMGYSTAVIRGSLMLTQGPKSHTLQLHLSGTIRWLRPEGERTQELPRLSIREHRAFLDELETRLKPRN